MSYRKCSAANQWRFEPTSPIWYRPGWTLLNFLDVTAKSNQCGGQPVGRLEQSSGNSIKAPAMKTEYYHLF